MTTKNEEKKDLTGISNATNKKDAEYDITTALLKSAEFRSSEEAVTEIEIRRNGEYFFTLHVHPLSDADARKARKKATTYMPNPQGRKYPPIEKDFNGSVFNSHIIYMATTEEDKEKIWHNKTVMDKYDILDVIDMVDLLLAVGEKLEIVDTIMDISGMDEDEVSPEDYAKN